jgi:hypothetical protein
VNRYLVRVFDDRTPWSTFMEPEEWADSLRAAEDGLRETLMSMSTKQEWTDSLETGHLCLKARFRTRRGWPEEN